MAKPVIKFTAVPYEINGYKGYRPQLESKDGVFDLAFCREVVEAKRLAMSAEELLHAMEMAAEVATSKVAEDGRSRGVTKLIKWAVFGSGNLESPSSPWNASCKATIRPILLGDATKLMDATFQNTTEGIGVRLNDVTYEGAKTVQNVIKQDGTFSANGSHMEFLEGDSASIVYGETVIPLECLESDVSHARFAAPEALYTIEPGTQVVFRMVSRGGVEDGQSYTCKKTVTLLAGVPHLPKIVSVVSGMNGKEGQVRGFEDTLTITGEDLSFDGVKFRYVMIGADGEVKSSTRFDRDGDIVTYLSPTCVQFKAIGNYSDQPTDNWISDVISNEKYLEARLKDGTILRYPIIFVGED